MNEDLTRQIVELKRELDEALVVIRELDNELAELGFAAPIHTDEFLAKHGGR